MAITLVGDNNNGFVLEMFILQNPVQHVHVFAMYSFILVTAAMEVVWISMLVIAVMVYMVVTAMVNTVVGVVAMVTTCMGAILAIFFGAIRFTTMFIISVLHLQRYKRHLTDLSCEVVYFWSEGEIQLYMYIEQYDKLPNLAHVFTITSYEPISRNCNGFIIEWCSVSMVMLENILESVVFISHLMMNVGFLAIMVTGLAVITIGIVSVVDTMMVAIAVTVMATTKSKIFFYVLLSKFFPCSNTDNNPILSKHLQWF